jgi:pimeloyl-ACP methyl ester carboxylesterase
MHRSAPVDGFSLAYERSGSGDPVVLLHGWPGDHGDWREVAAILVDAGRSDVVVPDLRGFGESDKHPADPDAAYSAAGQAESVIGLINELGLRRPVVAGYDIGSRIAQRIALAAPESVRALVIAPPLPGVGRRVLGEDAVREFWYQAFHRTELIEQLLDGDPVAVREYLRYIWGHWSGPGYTPQDGDLDRLAASYGAPGAFVASVAWYRGGSGTVARSLAEEAPAPHDRVSVPATVLWPEHDPLFPREWGDRINEFFSAVTVADLPGAGHFSPLEAAAPWAAAIAAATSS